MSNAFIFFFILCVAMANVSVSSREHRTARDDQHVVGNVRVRAQTDGVLLDLHTLNRRVDEHDAVVQLTPPGVHDVLKVREFEEGEQESRLVGVKIILINGDDGGLIGTKHPPKLIRRERAVRAGPQMTIRCTTPLRSFARRLFTRPQNATDCGPRTAVRGHLPRLSGDLISGNGNGPAPKFRVTS